MDDEAKPASLFISVTAELLILPHLTLGAHDAWKIESFYGSTWLPGKALQSFFHVNCNFSDLKFTGQDMLFLGALAQPVMMQSRQIVMNNIHDWLGDVQEGEGIFQELNLTLAD